MGKVCKTENCFNVCSPKGNSPYCSKCRSRTYRKNNPITASYAIKKYNAEKVRKIPFQVTLPEWKEWVTNTGYLEVKGQSPESGTVDRPDETLCYTIDNMQVLSLSDNIKKGKEERKKGRYYKRKFPGAERQADDPF